VGGLRVRRRPMLRRVRYHCRVPLLTFQGSPRKTPYDV
jgi:hypothetical protein